MAFFASRNEEGRQRFSIAGPAESNANGHCGLYGHEWKLVDTNLVETLLCQFAFILSNSASKSSDWLA
jgi:hypothetical protein